MGLCLTSSEELDVPEKDILIQCSVMSTLDARTVQISTDSNSGSFTVKILGIDVPSTSSNNDLERNAAIISKRWLEKMLGKTSVVCLRSWSKNEMYLWSDFYNSKGEKISSLMIQRGYARSSNEKPKPWYDDELKVILANNILD